MEVLFAFKIKISDSYKAEVGISFYLLPKTNHILLVYAEKSPNFPVSWNYQLAILVLTPVITDTTHR